VNFIEKRGFYGRKMDFRDKFEEKQEDLRILKGNGLFRRNSA
jgi:hypothetical protein